ncbi:MAG TPA: VOC family protein [Candidatus Dormibacteraeota bacterium]|nr:VOC family protein [Candidatus Dormibacteraeota bacterium]
MTTSLLRNEEYAGLIQGLHHITLVTSNAEINRKFYTEVLGLRRVKLTVNQDDVHHRHMFYADEKGTTGSAITFFEWPHMRPGRVGLGSPHHLSYNTSGSDSLTRWKSWLERNGVSVRGPLLRDNRTSIYLRDPDGVTVEITTPNDGEVTQEYIREAFETLPAVNGISREMKLTTFHHASPINYDPEITANFFDKFLGLTNKLSIPNPDQIGTNILGIGSSEQPSFLRYLVAPKPTEGYVGEGSIHHIAMAVEDDEAQQKILRQLNRVGVNNSGIIDRFWFHSLYFRDPDGNLLEIATKNPGYAVDEPEEKLGSSLVLPKWLEPRREEIESSLKLTDANNRAEWPPDYPRTSSQPEAVTQD